MFVRIAITTFPRPDAFNPLPHTLRSLARSEPLAAGPDVVAVFSDTVDPPDLGEGRSVVGHVFTRTPEELAAVRAAGDPVNGHNFARALQWASEAEFAALMENDIMFSKEAITRGIEMAGQSQRVVGPCLVSCHDMHYDEFFHSHTIHVLSGEDWRLFEPGPGYWGNGAQLYVIAQRSARIMLESLEWCCAHPTDERHHHGFTSDCLAIRAAKRAGVRFLLSEQCLVDHMHLAPSSWHNNNSPADCEVRRTKRFVGFG